MNHSCSKMISVCTESNVHINATLQIPCRKWSHQGKGSPFIINKFFPFASCSTQQPFIKQSHPPPNAERTILRIYRPVPCACQSAVQLMLFTEQLAGHFCGPRSLSGCGQKERKSDGKTEFGIFNKKDEDYEQKALQER